MLIRLTKDEMTNNILNVLLILFLLPTIKQVLSIFTLGSQKFSEFSSQTAVDLGVINPNTGYNPVTGTTTNTNTQSINRESIKGLSIAQRLQPVFNPKSYFGFTAFDVNEEEVISILNECKNDLEIAYTIYHYANLYGKKLRSEVDGCLNSREYNQLYRWVRTYLEKQKK